MCLSVCYNYATAELSCSIFEQKPNVKFAVSDVSIEWPQNEVDFSVPEYLICMHFADQKMRQTCDQINIDLRIYIWFEGV